MPSGTGEFSIVDITGKTITTAKLSGKGEFVWNAENVASGIYFARLAIKENRVQTKLVLLK